jgi:hypothetical protein
MTSPEHIRRTALKEQIDIFLKLSDQIDGLWRLFMWANVTVVGAIAFVDKTLEIKLLILLYYSVFLFMNYGALIDNYKGINAVLEDLLDQTSTKESEDESKERAQFKKWIQSLRYSDRTKRVRWIFAFGILFTASLCFVFPPNISNRSTPPSHSSGSSKLMPEGSFDTASAHEPWEVQLRRGGRARLVQYDGNAASWY